MLDRGEQNNKALNSGGDVMLGKRGHLKKPIRMDGEEFLKKRDTKSRGRGAIG